MTYRLDVSPVARIDLVDLHAWIVSQAGDDVADAYLRRMIARLASLVDFPSRGSPRPELGEGVRSIPFERRRIIIYRVGTQVVTILRVVDGTRDLRRLFN